MYFLAPVNYLKEDKKDLYASKEQKLCICVYSAFPQWAELKDKDKEEQHTKIQLFCCTGKLTFASERQSVHKLPTNTPTNNNKKNQSMSQDKPQELC